MSDKTPSYELFAETSHAGRIDWSLCSRQYTPYRSSLLQSLNKDSTRRLEDLTWSIRGLTSHLQSQLRFRHSWDAITIDNRWPCQALTWNSVPNMDSKSLLAQSTFLLQIDSKKCPHQDEKCFRDAFVRRQDCFTMLSYKKNNWFKFLPAKKSPKGKYSSPKLSGPPKRHCCTAHP